MQRISETVRNDMNFPVPAQKYIPQRPPIVMIDSILENSEHCFTTSFLIRPDNVFVEDGYFRETGLMENIAQTCAARIGFCSDDDTVPLGVIGGISDFVLHQRPKVGDTLTTSIHVVADIGPALVVSVQAFVNQNMIASCSMKVFIA